jgi:hypothetical protein
VTAARRYEEAQPRVASTSSPFWPRLAGARAVRRRASRASALYDERLGDQRRFGFPSDTELVVARSRVVLDGAVVRRYDARVLGYRMLRAPLPEATGRSRALGWDMFLDVSGNRSRDVAAALTGGWGALMPIVDRGELADHLMMEGALVWQSAFFGARAAGWARAPGRSR